MKIILDGVYSFYTESTVAMALGRLLEVVSDNESIDMTNTILGAFEEAMKNG